MITVAEPDRIAGVRRALAAAGAQVMDAPIVAEGVALQVE